MSDTDLEYSAHVFRHIIGVNEAADLLDEIMSASKEKELILNRDVVEVLTSVLRNDASLIKQLFEENRYIYDRVEAVMRKNHPKK